MVYQLTLGIAFVISVAIPFVIYANRHRWDTTIDRGRVGGGCRRRGRHRRETRGRDGCRAFRSRIGESLGGRLAADAFEYPAQCDGQQALAQPGRRLGRTASKRSERAQRAT